MTGAAVTRARLAEEVARRSGITRREADVVVDTVFDSIREALCRGEEVEIRGFGSFRLRRRNARETRNPRTGQQVRVPSKQVAFFRAGKVLRSRLNEPGASGAGNEARTAADEVMRAMFPSRTARGVVVGSPDAGLPGVPLAARGNEPD